MQPLDKTTAGNPGQPVGSTGVKSFVDIAKGILERHGFNDSDKIAIRFKDCDIDGSGNQIQHLAISSLKSQPIANARRAALVRAIKEIETQTGLPVPYKIGDAANSSFNIELSYSTTRNQI